MVLAYDRTGRQMEFRILGELEVRAGGERLYVGGPREQKVLAILLLAANRVVPLGYLVDGMWGDDPPATACKQVRNHVSSLRRMLFPGGAPDGITTSRAGYRLAVSADALDACAFEAGAGRAAAAAAAGRVEEAADVLRSALGLWRGPALAGMTGMAIEAAASAWNERRQAVLETYYDHRLALGHHCEVIGELSALAVGHPVREKVVAQLMLTLYRCGRQGEALAVFAGTRRVLVDELGIEPCAGLRRLHERILAADESLDLLAGTSSSAAPSSDMMMAAGTRTVPAQLPADVDAFAGRAGELAQLDLLLAGAAPGAVAVSAVSGTAGVGKTALAVRWAHRVRAKFPDGQLYVNLRGYDTGRLVPATDALAGFLRALGVAGQRVPAEADERASLYRSLLDGRRMLILLDNAGTAEHVRPLLPGTPSCVVLVTSRDSLAGLVARDGARRLELDLLSPDEAVALLRVLIGGPADEDPDAAAALAEQCARLPLALRVAAELAAARPDMALAALARELAGQQRRLDLLDAGGDPATAVRSVFSWSWRHLHADAARAFRLLGLHPGPDFDCYSAAALTGTSLDQARFQLDLLARAHLIQPGRPGRYGMHDLLHAYAASLTDTEDERRAPLTGLLDYYLAAAAAAMDVLFPAERHLRPRIPPGAIPAPLMASPQAARAWLDADRPVLVAMATEMASGWPDHTVRLAATLFRYLDTCTYHPGIVTIYTHARDAAERTGDRAAQATALSNLGVIAWRQGNYRQSAAGHRPCASSSRNETRTSTQPGPPTAS